MSTNYQCNQLVRLRGLNNASYNGKLARVLFFPSAEVCCNGRYRVKFIDEVAPPLLQSVDVKPENMEHACQRCHKGGEKLMFCAKCKNARYCDRECQRIDWENHKELCRSCGFARDTSKNPLYLAAIRGAALSIMRKLVEEDGIDVNMTSNTTNRTALLGASAMGHLSIVQYLLQHGADLHKADNNGVSPLFVAAQGGYLPVVRLLVEQGANKDETDNSGNSPLFVAAQKGHLGVVRYLVEQGADKDKAASDGCNPLLVAAMRCHLPVLRYLLEQGADKDMPYNNSYGPLLLIAAKGHLEVVRLLVEHGTDVNRADSGSCLTPLHAAARYGHAEVLSYLMREGASLTARDSAGTLPIDCAANEEIRQLIRDEEKRRRENPK